jgi:8-oxo-dGTP pyrophosphatase MutT (NUDIX family)
MLFGKKYEMSEQYIDEINITLADPNDLPLKPKPASTVLLIRDSQDSIEVFMIKRAATTNFGNAWVFPGGKVDAEDILQSKEN